MKCFLILLLSLPAFTAVADAQQDRLVNGFMEIPWGAPPDQAREALETRSHAVYNSGSSIANLRWWDGGTFAGYPAAAEHSFALEFSDNKLRRAAVFLQATSKGHKEEYRVMKKLLTEKYGTRATEHTQGEDWHAEWKCSTIDKNEVIVTLENAPGAQGCKISYTFHALFAPDASPSLRLPSQVKKDL